MKDEGTANGQKTSAFRRTNPKTAAKALYLTLAEAPRRAWVKRTVFWAFRMARALCDSAVPERFYSRTVVVSDVVTGQSASIAVWGNESAVGYLEGCLERSGLSLTEPTDPAAETPKPSIRFCWHNRIHSSRFRRKGWLVLPGLVTSRLDLSRDIDAIRDRFSRSAKRAGHMVKASGYSSEVLPCKSLLKSFYNQMYLPYCESRFASHPVVKSYELVEALSNDSALLMVSASGMALRSSLDNALGGVMIRKVNASASLVISGLGGDPEEAMRRGVAEALYWFAIEWCHSQGVKSLNLGLSHPFLDDGVLRFKAKWGASVEPSRTGIHNLALRFEDNGWLAKHFLTHHPLIIQRNRQPPTANLVGIVYLPGAELTSQRLAALRRRLMIGGLGQLVLVSDPDQTLDVERLAQQLPQLQLLPCYDLRYLAGLVSSL